MGISWDTYYALPHLANYAEAKQHYDRVVPIKRDQYNTKPAGRRTQKWTSIWENPDKSISIGYGCGELEKREPFITFNPNGTIIVSTFNRYSSASTNERMGRILGTRFETYQYDTWVQCAWFDSGVRKAGWLPLQRDHKARYAKQVRKDNVFVRDDKGELTFLNYTYPVTHKLNQPVLKQELEPYAPFLNWVSGMAKLQGTKNVTFEEETKAEYFGWSTYTDWRGNKRANNTPNIRWGDNAEANTRGLLNWMKSDNIDDWMRAAIVVDNNTSQPMRSFITEQMLHFDSHSLLTPQVHTGGRKVKDRFKYYLRK